MVRITTAVASRACHTVPLTVVDMRVEALVVPPGVVSDGGVLVPWVARVILQVRGATSHTVR